MIRHLPVESPHRGVAFLLALVMLSASITALAAQPGGARAPARGAARPPLRRPPRPMGGSVLRGELPAGPEKPAEDLPAAYHGALGQIYLQHGQWSKAQESLQAAYAKEKAPARRAPYAHRLAQLHMRKKEYDKALLLLEEAAKQPATKTNTYEIRRYRTTLATLLERMGQNKKAEEVYQQWLKDATGYQREMARRELLRFWQRTGKLRAAIEVFENTLKQTPDDVEALESLRLIYTSIQPDAAKALRVTEKLVATKPDDRSAGLALLSAYERARKYDKAIELVNKLIAKQPAEKKYLVSRLVNLYIMSGQKAKAAQHAEQMLAKEPKSAQVHARAAGIYQQLGKVEEALTHYEAAAKLAERPADQDRYLLSAAYAARRAKKYGKAESFVKGLIRSQNKTMAAQAKRLLFELYEEQNKLDQLEIGPRKP